LQLRTVQIAHEAHFGLVKTKMLLREKVWFVGIDKLVSDIISSCLACAATTPQTQREPLKMSPLPSYPWQQLSVDFCGPIDGQMLMVVMDDMSRYPVVEVINSTSANTVIAALDRVMSLFSIPEVIRTDNGPPFNSQQFKEYAETIGFKHRKITPYWPQANGECERFMRTMEKALRIAKINGNSWKQELHTFLRAYRTTPHCTTKRAPSEVLFNRPVRSRLPEYVQKSIKRQSTSIYHQDAQAKQQMKLNADSKNRANTHMFKIGDVVLVKQELKNKLSSYYEATPYCITAINRSMITATRSTDNRTVTRNSSFFKPFPAANVQTNRTDETTPTDADDDITIPTGEPPANRMQIPSPHPATVHRYPQRNRMLPRRLNDFVVG